ncbi:MAG: hypothetical protein C0615_00690 [Desulfuromonas sp.]|nr:MAG: hypothetical protein C0615_00690 [Desulfuromonas sp.]
MLHLVDSATELTTAATDALLALVAFICLVLLCRSARRGRFHRLWLLFFASLGIASLLGAVAHGLRLSEGVDRLIWPMLYLCLGYSLTALALVALHDWRGMEKMRKLTPLFMFFPFLVVALIWVGGGAFIYFLCFEAAVVLFALFVYGRLAFLSRVPGSGFILAGILFSLAAALVQASGAWRFELVWLFDHNGLFHLIQLPGLVCFVISARVRCRQSV